MRPVTFHYKPELDKTGIPQFGLVAEEVDAINPDLVTRDKEGKVTTVRYEAVNAMLLNEFLKEHRKNQQQEVTVARLEKQIEVLAEGLQKVGAELESTKSCTAGRTEQRAAMVATQLPACGKISWCSCSRKRKNNQHITRHRIIKLPLGELLRGELAFEIFMAANP